MAEQIQEWKGVFGRAYTGRNRYQPEEIDCLYEKKYGRSRRELNEMFLGNMPRDLQILEVGANVGNQLLYLEKMGFKNLCGIEVNPYAVEEAKKRSSNIHILEGAAQDIPFRDQSFDLVFTSGVLIHIPSEDLARVMWEMYRCSRKYIWGFEYFAEQHSEVVYRGQSQMMWKANFAKLFCDQFKDLSLLKEERFAYLEAPSEDAMFLLQKETVA